MSVIDNISDKVISRLTLPFVELRKRVLGVNNERIDFLMDSFYKLNPTQQAGVIAGIIGGVILFVILAVSLYFARVSSLKSELDESFLALKEFESNRRALDDESKKFDQMASNISGKISALRIKPFLEAKTKEFNIQMDNISEQTVPISSDDPLAERLNEVKADLRISKVSLPRLVKFLVEVESGGNYLRVQDLTIRSRHEDKLYFDVQAKIRGYAVK